MNHAAFQNFIKTPKGKLTLALGAMFLSWIFLFLNFSSTGMLSLPSEARKAEIKQEIRKLRTELKTLNEKKQTAENRKKQWRELAAQSWQEERDGDPELLLRQKIEGAARKSELKLNNLGTVRITKVNQDFSFAELDVSASTKIAPLMAFVHEIEQIKPEIAWRRFSVFTMMRRPRSGNSRTVSSNATDDNLIFSGNLRMLVYHPENGDSKTVSVERNGKNRTYQNIEKSRSNHESRPEQSPARVSKPNRRQSEGGRKS